MSENHFNIRIYGLFPVDGYILVTDEFRLGMFMTKFPGGALEFGEGAIDCLRREFREELNSEINHISHFYTTDFYQPTTLLPKNMQLFNVYYSLHIDKPYPFKTTGKLYDIPAVDGAQSFRWMKINELKKEDFTFPVDRYIIEKIKTELR
ncbi:MAG: NUDIX domain-containing protein [Bacteroidetes bacterium]|nr:NUDIX domain-containing protein [Bacteroidota bacterium]